jgi:KaiC/GvpD/RAD55 family RecA-like ATPase
VTDGDVVAEILGRAISQILPDHRASGTPAEHAQSTATALLKAFAGERAHIRSLEGLLVDATNKRDRLVVDVLAQRAEALRERDEARAYQAQLLARISRGNEIASREADALLVRAETAEAERDEARKALVEATARHAETVARVRREVLREAEAMLRRVSKRYGQPAMGEAAERVGAMAEEGKR